MKDFEPIFTHSHLESFLWCFSPNSTVAIKRCSSWNDETASAMHYSPAASCCLLCACSNKNPFLQCRICLGLKWSTPTGIQVQRENKLNAQNVFFFLIILVRSSSSESLFPSLEQLTQKDQAVVLWPVYPRLLAVCPPQKNSGMILALGSLGSLFI